MIRAGVIIAIALALWSCSSTEPWVEPDDYILTIDGRLPLDSNGFYHLKLRRDRYQTVHRISGSLLDADGKAPYQEQKIAWESSHTWSFLPGDTVITIYRRNVDQTGHWVVIDTAAFVAPMEMIVPTVNASAYSSASGEINTVVGPVLDMLGDTMTIRATWTSQWYVTDTIRAAIRIVLD